VDFQKLALDVRHTYKWKNLLTLLVSITLPIVLLSQNNALAASVGDGSVDSTIKINDGTDNGPSLSDDDYYGIHVTSIGDLDGDGVSDIAVGAYGDNTGGTDRGAFYIHFMNADGSIDSTVEINGSTANGATLSDNDHYGNVAGIGDLDGDGVPDLAVGAGGDDTGGTDRGAFYIHFMNTDGSIDSTVKIDDTTTNGASLSNEDTYGFSIVSIGDLNDDGVQDLAVGAYYDDTGGIIRGTVHIHFMNTDGSIDSTVEINSNTTNGPSLPDYSYYGLSIAAIGDLDGDGVEDLAVGAPGNSSVSGGSGVLRGSAFIHFMNTDGSIDSTVEINENTANGPTINDGDIYGFSMASIGDLDGDGVSDLVVGAPADNTGGTNRGALHIHFMNTDGSIDSTVEINDDTANGPVLCDGTFFGASVASIGDLNGDGINDIVSGADEDDGGGEAGALRGSIFILFMHKVTSASVAENKFSEDKRCHWTKPPEITWIKITPEEKDGISGILLTWVQYDANKLTIKIDDGTGNFPWKVDKTSNDGHEFLPNVCAWQELKVKPYNHCKGGEYSTSMSYNLYPYGWYND